ncbi:hypothetical protein Fcan01_00928 [Folsomia candida]|uniref:Gustatory receptor n=1 Tax=Folsomia candida TaxID=158441 RepID=A0A226F0X9_FOLCA|nr:hypothetical protein Fcan01_00928 [Folsomia candida]
MLMQLRLITWVQTLTPLKALQRFSRLSELLYPQPLSFDRTTWQPTPTPKSKLIPWYFLSFLCVLEGMSFYFILFQQILSHQKDPEISGTIHILLLILSIGYSFSTTIFFEYHTNVDEICFVIRNTLKFKDQLNESSTLPGLFFHGIISFIVMVPLGGFVVMILRPKVDPTYLWFRNVTIISCEMKLFFRLCLYCSTLLHVSVLIFGLAIIGVNIIVPILRSLERPISSNYECRSFLNVSKYITRTRTYRQLQIITQVINQLVRHILLVGALILVLSAAMLGFMVIKMAWKIPFALVFLAVTVIGAILGFVQIGFSSMADVMRKSADFKRDLEFQGGYISYRKRQLRSLKVLKIWVGSYFFIHKGTRIELFGLIAYHTMSLVISV